MSTSETTNPAEAPTRPGPRKSLAALRICALATLLSTLAQPVLAALFLDGDVSALSMHHANAGILHMLEFAQLIAAWVYWRPGGGPAWPLLTTAVLWLLAGFQFAVGESANLTVHVPLGVAIVLLQGYLTVWTLGRRARRPARAASS